MVVNSDTINTVKSTENIINDIVKLAEHSKDYADNVDSIDGEVKSMSYLAASLSNKQIKFTKS